MARYSWLLGLAVALSLHAGCVNLDVSEPLVDLNDGYHPSQADQSPSAEAPATEGSAQQQLQRELTQCRRRLAEREKELKKLEGKNDHLKDRIDQLEDKIEDLED